MAEAVHAAAERSMDRRPASRLAVARPRATPVETVRAARRGHDISHIPVYADRHEREATSLSTRLLTPRPADRDSPRAAPRPASRPDGRLGTGRPLNRTERARYESALGMDLRGVRVHEGRTAHRAAHEKGARAYTYGNHIVFGQSADGPARDSVLAHELVHVRQQARGPPGERGPPVHPAPLGVQCLPEFLEDAGSFVADTASDVAGAVVEGATAVGEFASEGAEFIVDRVAPGLLRFLRGGVGGQLTELLCAGVNFLLERLFSGLSGFDPMTWLEETFTGLSDGVRGAQSQLAENAGAFVGSLLRPIADALSVWGDPIIDRLYSAATTINEIFSGIWNNLAVPALDLLESVGGAVWGGIQRILGWLWDLTGPIRAAGASVWNWLVATFGLAWDSTASLREWLAKQAAAAWDALMATIAPIRGPLMAVAGSALLLSPVGPFIVLSQAIPPLWDAITWLVNNWNTRDILVTAGNVLRDTVLPAVIRTVSGVATTVTGAAAWLAETVAGIGRALSSLLGIAGGASCLRALNTLLTGISEQFRRLAVWADGGLSGLQEALAAAFDAMVTLFRPILDFLVRLAMVIANPVMLPVALTTGIWLLCPDDLKPPVIRFVLGLLIAALTAFPAFLTLLGPLAELIKEGAIGFLSQLRMGTDDELMVDAANKFANLAVGGGVEFIAGFAVGVVEGVIDGILDPFRLLYLIAQLLVAAMRAINRVLDPLLAPAGPATTPARAPPLSEAHPAPAPADAGTSAAAEGQAAELSPALTVGDLTDAAIAVELSPSAIAALGPAEELSATEADADAEIRGEGVTVQGLAGLLAGAWDAMVAGARGLGARAASAFLGFILQPDFDLGRKIGFVAGMVLLEALVAYLTAGGYLEAKAAEPMARTLLRYLLRFLDLGGELFSLLGRALAPLRGPLTRGAGFLLDFLRRFRSARGIADKLDRWILRVLGFADEAASAAGRVGRRAERETVGELAGEAGERGVRRANDLGEGAVRAADDPRMPHIRDDAAKVAELPIALAKAKAIEAGHDAMDSPIPLLLGHLLTLRTQYRWIDTFTATPTGVGRYQITMIASEHPIGTYTTGRGPHAEKIDRLIAEAESSGQSLDRAALERAAATDPGGFPSLAGQVREEMEDRAARKASRVPSGRVIEPDEHFGPGHMGPGRPHPEIGLPESRELAAQIGVPQSIMGDGVVMTKADFADLLPSAGTVSTRPAPAALPVRDEAGQWTGRKVALTSSMQNIDVRHDVELLEKAGASDIRINQTQVDAAGALKLGTNRPDLQVTIGGRRIHIEYDRAGGPRALEHARRILSNDPSAIVILKVVDFEL